MTHSKCMPAVDPVILELRANLRDYDNKLNASTLRAERSFQAQENAIKKLEFQVATSSGRIGSRLDRMGQVSAAGLARLQGVIGAVSFIALARGFLAVSDASKQMNAQLRLATQSFGTLGQAQDDVERVAAETRSGLGETTNLYGNMLRATQALGGTQADAARATETFSKALKIGGADANSAASATLQFGQALASGALRGDEFNSIAEASPRILRLLAESLGVPQGALRKMAEEGKLTSDVLQRALTDTKFTAGIDAEFRQLPVTFDDAMTSVRNAAIITFGAFDRGGQFSTTLANFFTDGASGFGDLEKAAEDAGMNMAADFAGLRAAFEPMVEGAFAAFGQVDARARESSAFIEDILKLADQAANIRVGAANFSTNVRNGLIRGGVLNRNFVGGEGPLLQRQDSAGAFRRARAQSIRNRRAGLAEDRLNQVAALQPGSIGLKSTGGTGVRQVIPTSSGPKKRTAAGPSAETLAKRAEAERVRALRDDQQFENEKAALNADLLRAKQSIVTAADVIAQYELQEIEAQRVRQNANYQAEVAQKKLTQARADELIALNDKVAVERGNVVRAREEERKRFEQLAILDADLQNARDIAASGARLAETTQDRRAASLRLLDLEYEMEKVRLDAILASKQATDAEKEIARRRLALLPDLKAVETEGVNRDTEGSYARYRRNLPDTIGEVNDRLDDIKVDAMRRLEDSIVSATTKTLGLKGALGDIVGELIRIAIQRKIIGPLADGLFGKADGSTGGSLGGLFSSIATAFGGKPGGPMTFGRASGGYVGPGQTVRVNENRGPGVELLRMGSRGGTVIPLGQANATARRPAAGMTVLQTIQVDARGAVMADSFATQILARADQGARQIVSANNGAIRKGLPAAQQRFSELGTTG